MGKILGKPQIQVQGGTRTQKRKASLIQLSVLLNIVLTALILLRMFHKI